MPYPNSFRTAIRCVDSLNGRLIVEETRYVVNGRTRWTGNQRRKRNRGFNPPTACSSTVVKSNTATYRDQINPYRFREGSVTFAYNRWAQVSVSSEPSEKDRLNAQATTARRFTSHSGLGETLIESPDSLRLITRRVRSFSQIIFHAGRGNFSTAMKLLRESTGYNYSNRSIKRLRSQFGQGKTFDSRRASAFWLETNFAFLPLFQSIYDSVKAFSNASWTHTSSSRVNGARVGYVANVTNSRVYLLHQLGLTNPLALAWDLVPFSFVLDWFLPIGAILRWMGSNFGTDRVYGWMSTTRKVSRSIRDLGVFIDETSTYARTLFVPDPIRAIGNATPRSASLWQAVTALSLLDGYRR